MMSDVLATNLIVMTQVGHNMEQHESVTYSSSEETVKEKHLLCT